MGYNQPAKKWVLAQKKQEKVRYNPFEGCPNLKAIIVPAKRSNYYKKRLPEELWGLIVEQEPEEKPRKKTSNN